jgi:hypothetical protein
MKPVLKPALSLFMCAVTLLSGVVPSGAQQAKALRFSGYEWEVRPAGKGGPGPNQWDPNNVWVDKHGQLHLKITKVQNEWRCAELYTTKRLGFGRYQFQVIGRIDRFDPSVVLGLFNYPTPDVGQDGTNEIDIEIAHWGNPKWDNGNFTIYPSKGERVSAGDHHTFPFSLNGEETTHRFTWSGDQIAFEVLQGLRDTSEEPLAGGQWVYAPHDTRLIPQQPLPVHINLWLFAGKPQPDQKEIEIVVKRFTFTPLNLIK